MNSAGNGDVKQRWTTTAPRYEWMCRGSRRREVQIGSWRQRIDASTDPRAIQLSVDVGYYAPAARTTLNPECSCVLAP